MEKEKRREKYKPLKTANCIFLLSVALYGYSPSKNMRYAALHFLVYLELVVLNNLYSYIRSNHYYIIDTYINFFSLYLQVYYRFE